MKTQEKEAMMRSLKIFILFLSVLTFAFGSQEAAAQKSGDGSAIPYPKKEWEGVQGKPLRTRNPILSDSPKHPRSSQCTGHHAR
jgi:hypothetical protein